MEKSVKNQRRLLNCSSRILGLIASISVIINNFSGFYVNITKQGVGSPVTKTIAAMIKPAMRMLRALNKSENQCKEAQSKVLQIERLKPK